METVRTVPAEAPLGAGALLAARETGLRHVVRVGLLAGLTAAFIASIGMLVNLAPRLVVRRFSLDYVMLAIIPLAYGYLAGKPPPRLEGFEAARPGPRSVLAGAVAGIASTVVLGVYISIVGNFNIRDVFPNISPEMVGRMTFQQGLVVGWLLLAAASVVLSAIGGALNLLGRRLRAGVAYGLVWVVVFGLLKHVFSTLLDKVGFSFSDQLYSNITDSLTIPGAIGVFVVTTALHVVPKPTGRQVRDRFGELPRRQRRWAGAAVLFVALGILAVVPRLLSTDIAEDLNLAGIFLLMALGLNIVVGVAGLLDLGYVAFFAVGAYTAAVLMSPPTSLSPSKPSPQLIFWEAIPFVLLAAALAGILVGTPVLRMRGDYLAIVTLGFGEIASKLIVSTWLSKYLGGAFGVLNIKPFTIGHITLAGTNPRLFFYLIFGFAVLAAYASHALQDSRIGRAWMAIREDESVAEAMGVNVVAAKLWAFIIGAIVASVGGALFAVKTGSVLPQSFDITVSITVLAIVIIGGMGSIPGVTLAAIALIGLPQILLEFQDFRFLLYGALLIFMMLRRPEGFIPSRRRATELHEEEILQDAWLRAREAEAGTEAGPGQQPVTVEGS